VFSFGVWSSKGGFAPREQSALEPPFGEVELLFLVVRLVVAVSFAPDIELTRADRGASMNLLMSNAISFRVG